MSCLEDSPLGGLVHIDGTGWCASALDGQAEPDGAGVDSPVAEPAGPAGQHRMPEVPRHRSGGELGVDSRGFGGIATTCPECAPLLDAGRPSTSRGFGAPADRLRSASATGPATSLAPTKRCAGVSVPAEPTARMAWCIACSPRSDQRGGELRLRITPV